MEVLDIRDRFNVMIFIMLGTTGTNYIIELLQGWFIKIHE